MKYKIKVSEYKKRLKYNSSEVTKNVIRFLVESTKSLSNNNLMLRKAFLNKSVTRASVSFIHNRCVVTLRARSVFRLFKMSRHQIKRYGSFGRIHGLIKSAR